MPPRIAATEIGGQGRDAQGPEPQQENRQREGERGRKPVTSTWEEPRPPLPTVLLPGFHLSQGVLSQARMALEETCSLRPST